MIRPSVFYIFIAVQYIALLECREVAEWTNITEYCPGQSLTLQCCVNSSVTVVAMVWKGSSFDCPESNSEIILLRSSNASQRSNVKECVSNTVRARAWIESTENDTYLSKLNVTVLSPLNTSLQMMTFICQIDNGESTEDVSTYNIDVMSCLNESEITIGRTTAPSEKSSNTSVIVGVTVTVTVVLVLVAVVFTAGFITLAISMKKKKKVRLRHIPTISIQRDSLRQMNIGVFREETDETQVEAYNQLCFDRSFSITNHEYNRVDTMHGSLAVNNYSQLELKNMYGSTQNEEVLDLDSLLVKLRTKMDSKLWYQFGMELGVPVDILETLIGYPDDECMVELLDHWLRNHPDKPTWDEIEQVVRKFGEARNVSHYDIPVQLAIPVKGIYSEDK